jgi:hypothetical protein
VSDDEKPSTGTPDPAPEGTGGDSASGDAAGRIDLPKWNRARVKRSQPTSAAEPDAFQQGVRDAGRTAVRRGPLVFAGLVLVACAIAGGIWWRGARAESTAVSTRMLAVASAWRARGRVDPEAIAQVGKHPPRIPLARDEQELQRNVDTALAELGDAEGTKASMLAILVRAADQQQHADFASAQASYREFLAAAGEAHQLAFLAHEGLALALEGAGDTDGALAELEKLAGNEGDFYRDQALWQRARLLEQLGRTDEALALYRQYVVEFPLAQKSIARTEVKEHLGKLDPSAIPPEPMPGLGGPLGGLLPP